ncbi:MAG: hypothetical protein ACRD51_14970 [Candidatus Acidiferrum sp.]
MGQTAHFVHGFTAGQLKGRARSGLICALFGSAWMYWAVVFSGHPTPLWFLIVTLLAITLTVWAILRIRAFRRLLLSPAELTHWMRFRKFFWIDFGIEWGLCSIAAFLLARVGRFDLIPQAFGVIIGLHFLPLAIVFSARRYYWTGGIMVIAAVGSLIIPRGEVRNIVACASIGLTLWVTGIFVLYRISSASEVQATSMHSRAQ